MFSATARPDPFAFLRQIFAEPRVGPAALFTCRCRRQLITATALDASRAGPDRLAAFWSPSPQPRAFCACGRLAGVTLMDWAAHGAAGSLARPQNLRTLVNPGGP